MVRKMKTISNALVMALLMAALMGGCSGLNKRVETKIETSGSELTEVPVNVESVELGLFRGAGEITGVTVANPEGYANDNAFEMDLLKLNLGLFSIITVSHPLLLDELVIESPVLNLEFKEGGGFNIKEISDNVEKSLEKSERESKEKKKSDDKSEEPRLILVKRLVIESANFNLRRRDGTIHSGTLPDIELTDVGGKEGKTVAGLTAVVVVAMSKEMFKQALAQKIIAQGAEYEAQSAGTDIEVFIVEKVMSAVEPRLDLTAEQRVQLQMVIEMAVGKFNEAVMAQAGLGFLDYQLLSRQLGAIAESVDAQLKGFLDSEQMAEIKRYFTEFTAEVVEKVRELLFDQFATFLDLTPQQIERFRPIFREEMVRWSELFSRFRDAFQELKQEFVALEQETRLKLKGVLTEDQMKTLSETQEKLPKKILELIFPIE
jgi:hypothetical protein